MHRLTRQFVGQRARSATTPRAWRRPALSRSEASATCESERRHHVGAVSQIPLQDPVQARMAEVRQRPAHPACDVAQPGDRRRRQVARLDQCPAGQETQQPHIGGAVEQTRYGGALLAATVGHGHGDAQRRLRLGDQFRRQVLRFEFGRGERRDWRSSAPRRSSPSAPVTMKFLSWLLPNDVGLRGACRSGRAESLRPALRRPGVPAAQAALGN